MDSGEGERLTNGLKPQDRRFRRISVPEVGVAQARRPWPEAGAKGEPAGFRPLKRVSSALASEGRSPSSKVFLDISLLSL